METGAFEVQKVGRGLGTAMAANYGPKRHHATNNGGVSLRR